MSNATTQRSTWWSVTAFADEISVCEGALPDWVKKLYGGREKCETTGREHFQGALQCFEQVRMSKIKSWLPTAHLEPARSVDALKKYAMKEETAVGQKVVKENLHKFYKAHDLCELLARQDSQTDVGYYARVRMVLRKCPELAGQLMNPSLRKFWDETAPVWISKVDNKGGDSITPPLLCEGCGKDECEECYLKEQSERQIYTDESQMEETTPKDDSSSHTSSHN